MWFLWVPCTFLHYHTRLFYPAPLKTWHMYLHDLSRISFPTFFRVCQIQWSLQCRAPQYPKNSGFTLQEHHFYYNTCISQLWSQLLFLLTVPATCSCTQVNGLRRVLKVLDGPLKAVIVSFYIIFCLRVCDMTSTYAQLGCAKMSFQYLGSVVVASCLYETFSL